MRSECPECGTQIAPGRVDCPACGRLVHAETLKRLASAAAQAQADGDLSAALSSWRRAMELLPAGSRQLGEVTRRIDDLGRRLEEEGETPAAGPDLRPRLPAWARSGGVITAVALFLWKIKAILAFVLTKGKFLLLGLTKSSTLLSMLLSAGLYWTIWGWRFAVGLVLSIYVHEMGHVFALQRLGIRASAPMFLPGFGAVVRLRQAPASPREDARVGLAGPLWGLGATVVTVGLYHLTGQAVLAAVAQLGAWINLFNLVPVWQLDGGRAFRALDRVDRWVVVLSTGALWYFTRVDLLILLVLAGAFAAFFGRPAEESDRKALWQLIFLVASLAALCRLPVPGTEGLLP